MAQAAVSPREGTFDLKTALAGTNLAGTSDNLSIHLGYPKGDKREGDKGIDIYIVDKYTAMNNPHFSWLRKDLQSPQADVVVVFRQSSWKMPQFKYHILSFDQLAKTNIEDIEGKAELSADWPDGRYRGYDITTLGLKNFSFHF